MPLRKMKEINTETELREAFKVFDRKEVGLISAADLRAITNGLGENLTDEELDDIIREADIDGDKCISFEEFARMMMTQ